MPDDFETAVEEAFRPAERVVEPVAPGEPAPRQIGGKGRVGEQEAMNDVPPQDDLDALLARTDTNAITRLIVSRLRDLETRTPDAFKVGQSVVNMAGRIQEIERVVNHLSQQRAIQEIGMERQTRASALQMAINAVPDDKKGDPEMMTNLANAFLIWLKAGQQG